MAYESKDFPTARRLQCTVCGTSTPYEILSQYGARCRPCYDLFCSKAPSSEIKNPREALRALTDTLRKGHGAIGSQWAYRLKQRHEAGENLSRFQIDCYQKALAGRHVIESAKAGEDVPKVAIVKSLRHSGDLPSAQSLPWWEGLNIPDCDEQP